MQKGSCWYSYRCVFHLYCCTIMLYFCQASRNPKSKQTNNTLGTRCVLKMVYSRKQQHQEDWKTEETWNKQHTAIAQPQYQKPWNDNTRSTQKMAGNFNSRMINSGSPQIKRVTNIPETSERSTNEGLFSFFGYLWWAARKQLFVRLELIRSWTAKHNTYTFEERKKNT